MDVIQDAIKKIQATMKEYEENKRAQDSYTKPTSAGRAYKNAHKKFDAVWEKSHGGRVPTTRRK